MLLAAEFLKKCPDTRIALLLLLPFPVLFFLSYYATNKMYSTYTLSHTKMSMDDEAVMLKVFAGQAAACPLPQAEIAAAIQQYYAENDSVCHDEPFAFLETRLFPAAK